MSELEDTGHNSIFINKFFLDKLLDAHAPSASACPMTAPMITMTIIMQGPWL